VQGALENADVPFQQVVADANVPRSSAYSPLFQNLFTLADASFESALELDGASVEQAEVRPPAAPRLRRSSEVHPILSQAQPGGRGGLSAGAPAPGRRSRGAV